ncbi:hypothetical protein AB0F17_62860 [Nonomuraea sp. NPDC026600]|uniref:hypothetical protein n=1 Tax=Nonomuraea sp. NPDC026600 TaxID=3155363 RepID=UPI0033D26B61
MIKPMTALNRRLTTFDAETIAKQTARIDGWATVRAAVMAGLLRAKFTQHPNLAQALGTAFARPSDLTCGEGTNGCR